LDSESKAATSLNLET